MTGLNIGGRAAAPTPPAAEYILLEDGGKIILEDGTGDLLKEDSPP